MPLLNDMDFLRAYLAGECRRGVSKVFPSARAKSKYGEKHILSIEDGTSLLIDGIASERPFLAGRFGTSEGNALIRYFCKEKFGVRSYGHHLEEMVNNAGFFPKEPKMLDKYCELVKDLYSEIDLLCVMNFVAEDYLTSRVAYNADLTRLPVVDPLRTGWTHTLRGKKVLVIHPMEESIQKQYAKRELIFPNSNILPDFELKTIKAVQTIAHNEDARFLSWFDALEYMKDQALSTEFDVALIGCGAYGLPLACLLKRSGKKAIHMGGCLQLLFGIKGERWNLRQDYQPFFNDAWVSPLDTEKPNNLQNVEGGCYW